MDALRAIFHHIHSCDSVEQNVVPSSYSTKILQDTEKVLATRVGASHTLVIPQILLGRIVYKDDRDRGILIVGFDDFYVVISFFEN